MLVGISLKIQVIENTAVIETDYEVIFRHQSNFSFVDKYESKRLLKRVPSCNIFNTSFTVFYSPEGKTDLSSQLSRDTWTPQEPALANFLRRTFGLTIKQDTRLSTGYFAPSRFNGDHVRNDGSAHFGGKLHQISHFFEHQKVSVFLQNLT